MSHFLTMDVARCRRQEHHFKVIGSDKTPLKKSLLCLTCTAATGVSSYVAYGVETRSSGSWQARHRPPEEPPERSDSMEGYE